MSSFDIRNPDFSNAGGWPVGIKAILALIIVGLIVLAGWWFKVRHQQDELEMAQRKEAELRIKFEDSQAKAVNLEPLKAQLQEMEVMLQQMLRQLPSKTEMPDLIVDISQTALATGIQNDLFQPGQEVLKEFYAEKPIVLRMLGSYHQFGAFVSGVASLPRVVIMTMHDISLKPKDGQTISANGQLVLEGTVKTYRYLDEEEQATQASGGH
ncbi:MAG: type 4a pilus biogenesis protein PilO [Rhodanobacteraceae bacterium]|nr:type 4a pilus biogenesis protein PilO [Rhodanobacteraceae bacterium]HPF74134.1 type 4a pilus biogenesis protein PilO [Xanthomonadaceae bacterium]HRY00705.1 type 4a pilus biogenesis protein PilO [Xanthomonadaceae bacterium]